jgi:hypothetical protein
MAGKVRTWVWVVVGVFVFGILCLISLAAAGLWFAKTHINVTSATSASVSDDFQRVRERFKEEKPLIELDERGHFVRTNAKRTPAETKRPESLNVLAFDPDEGRAVRMEIPFWLLRLKMRGTRIGIGGDSVDLEDLKLSVEDLERYGPTLIVDHRGHDGERVLVWTQ